MTRLPRNLTPEQQAEADRIKQHLLVAGWARQFGGWVLEIVPKPERKKGEPFQVMKWRGIVERTFAWLGRYRRSSKDYKRQPETSKALIDIAMIHLMLRCLEPK